MPPEKFKEEKAHEDSIWCCAWGKNSETGTEYVLSGSLDKSLKIWKWNVDRLELLHKCEGHRLGIISVDVNRTGSLAVSSSLDSQIIMWDIPTGKQMRLFDGNPADAWTVALSPDSRYVATGSHAGNVNLIGVESGRKETTIPLMGKFLCSIAYSPDGNHLATGAIDGIIRICDVSTSNVIPLDGHAMPVRSLAFSQDGRLLASTSDDKLVKVFDVRKGTLVSTLTGHTGWVVSVDFNADNRHLATASSDRTVRVWDLAVAVSGNECTHTFCAHEDQAWCVRYSPDGNKLVSVGDDKTMIVYDCPT